MCPWEHEIWTTDDGERFCVEVCQRCGDTDTCSEPAHPHHSARGGDEDGDR